MTFRSISFLLMAGSLWAYSGEIRRIESRFMAPCCWHENLTVHDSPIAVQLRAEVAARAGRGESEEQIVNLFVSRYGERILAEPRGLRLWVLTAVPVAALAAGLLSLSMWLKNFSRRRSPELHLE